MNRQEIVRQIDKEVKTLLRAKELLQAEDESVVAEPVKRTTVRSHHKVRGSRHVSEATRKKMRLAARRRVKAFKAAGRAANGHKLTKQPRVMAATA